MTCTRNEKDTWLYKYREAIRAGEILACMDMTQELDNLLEDMDAPEYLYDTADADDRIDFIEHCVKLTKAPFYGKPFKLLLWQKAFIEAIYSFKVRSIDTGGWVRRFQECLLIVSRKNGKSELVAALELTEMILGEGGTDVVCSGTDDGTADLAYSAIDKMRELIDPKGIDTHRNLKGITCLLNGNHIYKLADSTRQKEGRNIAVAGIDEVWSLGDDGIYKTIQQSTSTKDEYLIWMFGSEGFVDDGFLDHKREEYRRIIYGEDDTDAAKRKLPWIYTQDSEREVWETNADGISPAWEKANPSIGAVKKWSYLKDRVDEARRSKNDRAFVLTKDFNIKVANSQAWLSSEIIDSIKSAENLTFGHFEDIIYIGGVDLAETSDMCAAKILYMKSGEPIKHIHSMYWIPEGKLKRSDDAEFGAHYQEWAKDGLLRIVEGNDIDTSIVADWFFEQYKDHNARPFRIGYDQRFAKQFINRAHDYGFEVEIVNQNRWSLTQPIKLVEADLMDGLIDLDRNPIDIWCLSNAALHLWDTGHMMLEKPKGQAGRRKDGADALVDCYEILRRYSSEYANAVDRFGR